MKHALDMLYKNELKRKKRDEDKDGIFITEELVNTKICFNQKQIKVTSRADLEVKFYR